MSGELRQAVRAALPPNVIALMDEIEAFADTPISIALNPYPLSKTDPNPSAPATMVTHVDAIIYLRDTQNIETQGILHELLHIHRYWVEGIPQIIPVESSEEKYSITARIENSIEHLVIVPRERDYGFDPYPYWNKTAEINWGRYPWPDMRHAFARRKNILLGRLGLIHLSDQKIIDFAKECIRKEGLTHEAERFNNRIATLLTDKPRALSCVCRFLKIPPEETQLVYLDIKNRRQRITSLPSH